MRLQQQASFVVRQRHPQRKVNVAASFGQKMPPVWPSFAKFSPAVPSRLNHGENVKCCLKRGEGMGCPLSTHNGTKILIRYLQKDHDEV